MTQRAPLRAAIALAPLLLVACSSLRWPWRGGGSCDSCQPPPRTQSPAANGCAPAPPPAASAPFPDVGPVVPIPDEEGPVADGDAAPGRPSLPAMPAGPRPSWSAASDPDLSALPPGTVAEPARPWTVIVVHHSATGRGGAALFDKMHKERGWEGVGYDFVIGNGTDTKDGEIEVTFRWRDQKDGAHAKGWNDVGIGICLVGNFENTDPTPAQRDALVRLLRHLRRRFGIPGERIVGHGTLNPTLCPGKRFHLAEFVAASAP